MWLSDALFAYCSTADLHQMILTTEFIGARAFLFHTDRSEGGHLMVSKTVGSGGTHVTTHYAYDIRGRLTGLEAPGLYSQEMTYSSGGNIGRIVTGRRFSVGKGWYIPTVTTVITVCVRRRGCSRTTASPIR